MTTIVLRSVKGTPLTNTEVDNNFNNLNTAKYEDGGALGTPISGNFGSGTFTWPTFNQNTTGTAANVTGVVALANGGTGASTVSTAQANLQVDPAGTAVAMAIALG
jgi:hypothetical protein